MKYPSTVVLMAGGHLDQAPGRNRSVEENLEKFGHEGTLRAKIDLSSPNMVMRDPILMRPATGHWKHPQYTYWPTYDFAQPLSDYCDAVTHSICTMEFVSHRPLYEWVLNNSGLPGPYPRQLEFAKLKLEGVTLGKRYILEGIRTKEFSGWDDPRLYTLSGLMTRASAQTGYGTSAVILASAKRTLQSRSPDSRR